MKDYSSGKSPELLLILIHAAFIVKNPKGYKNGGRRRHLNKKMTKEIDIK